MDTSLFRFSTDCLLVRTDRTVDHKSDILPQKRIDISIQSGKEDPEMKAKIMMVVSALATVVAALAASSACYWWIYQPEEPASLQDK